MVRRHQAGDWPRYAVTAPYLFTPGEYWIVICKTRPYQVTARSLAEAQMEEKRRATDWIETIFIDTTRRRKPKQFDVVWTSQRERCNFRGLCFLCKNPFPANTHIVNVIDTHTEREGWSHADCALTAND